MKTISAFEASDGTLHRSPEEAARASLFHLSQAAVAGQEGARAPLTPRSVEFLLTHAKEIGSILSRVGPPARDAADAA